MGRSKKADNNLVHLQVPIDPRHKQSDQEPNISGPIIESPALSRSRSFEYNLLVTKPEGENNATGKSVGIPPARAHSPFGQINPLRMCAPHVRSHANTPHSSSVLKTKQTFASPRTPNPGTLIPNARHTLSGITDRNLVHGEFSHFLIRLPNRFPCYIALLILMTSSIGEIPHLPPAQTQNEINGILKPDRRVSQPHMQKL